MCRYLAMLPLLFLILSAPLSHAASPAPSSSLTDEEKTEWWIGGVSTILEYCGKYETSSKLSAIADLTPHGKKGRTSWNYYDSVRGACNKDILSFADTILSNRKSIEDQLRKKYDCSTGECIPQIRPSNAQGGK